MSERIPTFVVEAREESCWRCKTPCARKGAIDLADPAEACPIHRWPCYAHGCTEEPTGALPQHAPLAPVGPRSKKLGIRPGDILAAMIKGITGQNSCTPCDGRRELMNTWGWTGTWRNREQVIDWMMEEARGRGHPMDRGRAFSLFLAAKSEVTGRCKKT